MSKKSRDRFLRNLSSRTRYEYGLVIKRYETFHSMTLEELIGEALSEQSDNVPPHELKVIDRIEDFQNYLIDEGLVIGTVKTYMGKIKTIYKRNRVNVPYIEDIDPKTVRRNDFIEFKDILTKDEIKNALKWASLPVQAKIYAMIQGGLSHKECEGLTTRTFLDDLYKYHQCDDDVEALRWLADEDNPVIWVTRIIRSKTKKPYYLLIGAEAVNIIARSKLYERGLAKYNYAIPDELFASTREGFTKSLRRLNDRLGLGSAGGYRRLRPHMLRKFHSTYISGSALNYEEHSLITNAEIDEMQGRGKTSVQDTYIKTNPIRQKVLYAKVMNNVCLKNEYEYSIQDNDVVLHRVDKSVENKKLKKEISDLSKKLEKIDESSQNINNLIEDIGFDKFKQILAEISNGSASK